ncbi:hypothetical protein SAMN04487770_13213 [Butyrivibrio sp. ob235]|uniref:hypothetical protein n=1 Tax=Butyrivibrio sp. ob235 TaxID=1761780 RepID=UPI0008CBDD91|nr:hypothetical protein [Butyrivibrio sp. ob235]SEM28389.1 hypothetical protein SAMN04487770_13213 [Butyrivibrio sp. ob235]
MAYKVSYKVVAEQGEQLKKIAKDMDNYVNQLNQIIGKLGGDELLVNIRNDLKGFIRQLEEERTVLDLSGQVLSEVIQSYSNVEKKTVQKVDRAKAHNRDFYKRPVVVASAGAGAGASASAGATAVVNGGAGQTTVNVSSTVINQNVTNNYTSGAEGVSGAGGIGQGLASALGSIDIDPNVAVTAAAAGLAAAAGSAAASSIKEKKKEKEAAKA